jgi:beta-glucosidase
VPFRSTYLDEPNSPLFAFGFGLGYTQFEYSELAIESPVVVSARVSNVGTRAGTEVVQFGLRLPPTNPKR